WAGAVSVGISLGPAGARSAALPGARRHRPRARGARQRTRIPHRPLSPRSRLESLSDQRRVHRLGISHLRNDRVYNGADERLLRRWSVLRVRVSGRQHTGRTRLPRQPAICSRADRGLRGSRPRPRRFRPRTRDAALHDFVAGCVADVRGEVIAPVADAQGGGWLARLSQRTNRLAATRYAEHGLALRLATGWRPRA